MSTNFRNIFNQVDDPNSDRSKYLSRTFGIFSEEIVAIWANDERAPYENLGRPTVMNPQMARGHTLDFTFRDRATGNVYVAEMKCEIQYQNFRYFILEASHQLEHHKKPAFEAFLKSAQHPDEQIVRVLGKEIRINGAILIWGAISADAKKTVMAERGFRNILSVEDICQELLDWQNVEYLEMVERYRAWTNRLFDGLSSR